MLTTPTDARVPTSQYMEISLHGRRPFLERINSPELILTCALRGIPEFVNS